MDDEGLWMTRWFGILSYAIKKNRIEIVQDATKGCIIQVREKDGRTICKGPYGYIPSGGIRFVVLVSIVFILLLANWAVKYLVPGIGDIPKIILHIILIPIAGTIITIRAMKVPSQQLVRRVGEVLEELAKKG